MPVGYGKRIREAVVTVKEKTKKRYACPKCSRIAVQRVSTGIWRCRKCGIKFASGSYEFRGR